MRVTFRPLRPAEPDWELVWGSVLAASAALGGLWIRFGLPTPKCVIYHTIGMPCFTCGGTRAMRALMTGDFATAWTWNPLVACLLILGGLFVVYAALVWSLRLPRLRVEAVSRGGGIVVRLAVVAVLASNWIYLIAHFSKNP